MEQIISLFPERVAFAISNTVLHSLWQISLISIFFFVIIKLKRNPSALFKYRAAISSLFISLACTIVSFIYFYNASMGMFTEQEITTLSTTAFSNQISVSGTFSFKAFLINNQSSISAVWLIGTLLLLGRFVAGVLKIATLKSTALSSLDKRLSYLTNTLSTKLNINKLVEIKESALIRTPIVIGHLKPLILFPVAVSTQLSMNEIEAILAHELAHVMRNDFIVNILQSLTEVLLYFHPCVWWLSSIVREERENCCDDIALLHIEDNLSYAKTLVKLQELQMHSIPNFALAFSGSKHHLKNRIMRILNQTSPSSFLREKLIAIALLFTFVLTFANNSTKEVSFEEETDCELEDVLAKEEFANLSYSLVLEDDTIPEKNTLIIKKKNKTESIDVKMEDGVITEMRIDGELIPENRYDEYSDRIQMSSKNSLSIHNPNFDFDDDKIISKQRSFILSDGNTTIDLDSIFGSNKESINEALKQLEHLENFSQTFPHSFSYEFDVDTVLGNHSKSLNDVMKKLEDMKGFNKIHMDDFSKHFEHLELDSFFSGPNNMKRFQFPNGEDMVFKHYNFDAPNGFKHHNLDDHSYSNNTLKSKMTRELNNDGFLTKGENKVELSGKQMKINGEKQPSNIWNKYKKLYEKYVGAELNKDSKIVLEIDYDGKDNRFFKSI